VLTFKTHETGQTDIGEKKHRMKKNESDIPHTHTRTRYSTAA